VSSFGSSHDYVASFEGPSQVPAVVTCRERELARWAPGLAVVAYTGSLASRELLRRTEWFVIDEFNTQYAVSASLPSSESPSSSTINSTRPPIVKFDVLLTSYELVTKDLPLLHEIVSSLQAHGGRAEFSSRGDGRDDCIDGLLPLSCAWQLAEEAFPQHLSLSSHLRSGSSGLPSNGSRSSKRPRSLGPSMAAADEGAALRDAIASFRLFNPRATDSSSDKRRSSAARGTSWGVLLVDEGHRVKSKEVCSSGFNQSNNVSYCAARHPSLLAHVTGSVVFDADVRHV
jgi:hypothetical protein